MRIILSFGVYVVLALKCLRLRKKNVVDHHLVLQAKSNSRKSASTRTSLKLLSYLEQIIALEKSILETETIEKQQTINFIFGDLENLEIKIVVYYHLV